MGQGLEQGDLSGQDLCLDIEQLLAALQSDLPLFDLVESGEQTDVGA